MTKPTTHESKSNRSTMADSDARANDKIRLRFPILNCFSPAGLAELEADPQRRDLKDEAVLWETEARTILGKICDDDSEAQLKVQSAEEAVEQAQKVAAQKHEEVKQALEMVQQKQEELEKCRTVAAARRQFGMMQRYAVEDEQEKHALEAYSKIMESLEAREEAWQKGVDDTTPSAKERT